MRKSYQYRLYPTKEQSSKLLGWLGLCRELYNAAIEERREAWGKGVSIRRFDQTYQLLETKKIREDLAEVNSQVLQDVICRVDKAFQGFFSRVKQGSKPGYPRFKGRDRYSSLTWPQNIGFRFVSSKLRLSGIGDVKIKLHRPVEGKMKTAVVKLVAGKWFVSISCDEVPARIYPAASQEVGIDMGLTSFATLSTGKKVENPRWFRKSEERIADAGRALSRKKRWSSRWAKAKHAVGVLHAKAVNQRKDFQHKLAHRIVSENRLIAVEDLNTKRMIEKGSSGLSKSIQDAAWATFLMILFSKAVEAGRMFIKVPAPGTTDTCNKCGKKNKMSLSDRVYSCSCGLVMDRDVHASLNILRLGMSLQAALAA